MRLFKSSNKSQASLERINNSRSSSPDLAHPRSSYAGEVAGPVAAGGAHQHSQSQSQSHPLSQQQQQQLQHQQQYSSAFPHSNLPSNSNPPYPEPQELPTHGQPHPAHLLTRTPQAPDSGLGYADATQQRPNVPINLIPPTAPQPISVQVPPGPAPIPGHTQFGQSKQVHVPAEKEHKRSKRSIFGLSKDKDKDKENLNSPVDKKGGLGRSGSIHLLRKSNHYPQQSTDNTLHSPSSPNYNVRQSGYFPASDQSLDNSPEDPSHYEQYRAQQQYQQQAYPPPPLQQQQSQQQPPQQHYDSPSSQYSQRSPQDQQQYHHYPPPQEKFHPYQQSGSSNASDHYLPYQQGQGQAPIPSRPAAAVIAEQQSLRPPSQSSLGPPSPIVGPSQQDSRPSTAQTSRFSAQSVGQGSIPQQMARDPQNGSTRQPMPQRDPREEQIQYQHDPRLRMSQHPQDQGRSTPPPRSSNREDPRELDYTQLLQKHEELQAKYSKVKRYYFEREAQVTQLQNTVATQRLSMSKTSLDDAQYAQRFERLSGAINNLAFNIRKDWKKVPPWLQPVCNIEAHAIGTKEMTGVGRTCITRWLNDTLFKQTFHPGLPGEVSQHLKAIESNLRNQAFSGLMFTDEQRDDHSNKLTTWRLTTIEGLAPFLNSKEAAQYQDNLTTHLTTALTGSLQANLKEPPPPGLQEGVATIISQAVSIAANIPLESRDIVLSYFMPGEHINEALMKVETGMTALTNPGQEFSGMSHSQDNLDEDDSASRGGTESNNVEDQIREAAAKATASGQQGRTESVNSLTTGGSGNTLKGGNDKSNGGKNPKGSSFLGGFVSKKPTPQQTGGSQRSAGAGVSREQLVREQQQQDAGVEGQGQTQGQQQVQNPNLQPGEGRIRFAAFLAVEVRGKIGGAAERKEGAGSAGAGQQQGQGSGVNVLYKAPVYEL
jgi:hypothetical protein